MAPCLSPLQGVIRWPKLMRAWRISSGGLLVKFVFATSLSQLTPNQSVVRLRLCDHKLGSQR
jgi:hypothetical protein